MPYDTPRVTPFRESSTTIITNKLPDADIRREQSQFARGQRDPAGDRRLGGARGPKFVAKGHDLQLQEAQQAKHTVHIVLMSGDKVEGQLVRRDKWTVTVRELDSVDEVIVYKHAIETIVIKKPVTASETH